jgi:KDO2-lipid IV(A) lauroyltransferase
VWLLENIIYGAFWTLGALIHAVPFPLKRAFARVMAALWFHGFRFRRQIILHNLARVFPRQSGETMGDFRARCEALAEKNLRHVVLSFLEILERFRWGRDIIGSQVEVHGHEHAARLGREKQGYFFLTAHLGNWELITIAGVFLGYPLAILTKRLRNGFFDRIWIRSRRRYGLELLEETGSGLALARAVRRGKAVGFILDQHTGEPHGIETKFLGLDAWCPKGLAILSEKLQAPILPAYMLRQDDGRFVLEIEPPLEFPRLRESPNELRTESGHLTDAGLRYHIAVCNGNMEKWILKSADQYLWLHRRFKNVLDYSSPLPWEP